MIGGWAVSFHGYLRATADMHVWVACDPENAKRIIQALKLFGFTHDEATESLFTRPGFVVRMGLPPMRIELLTKISGVEFAECRERCETMVDTGIPIPVISLADLIANKKARRPAPVPRISRIWMHSNPRPKEQKSGPIDNPGEKPKTLRETQSGRLYRVATRGNKHRSVMRSTDFS